MKVDWNEFILVVTWRNLRNQRIVSSKFFLKEKGIYFHFLYILDDDCKILET
jgi:hypothetical protein